MKINRKLIIGMITVGIGTLMADYPIIKHMIRKDALPVQLFGFLIMGIGVYYIFQGKKQQKEDAENNN